MGWCLVTLFVLIGFAGNAQREFRFDHITTKDGLSQSQPNCIFEDSRGYIWVGTQDGLNRFDGYEFKVYKNDPFDSTTITHNWIWSINEDDNGNIWVATFMGVCKLVRDENRFIRYFHSNKDSTSISGNRTNFILKDRKGQIWISSWGAGLNLYNQKQNTFARFTNESVNTLSISSNYIRTLFCDRDGTVWVGSNHSAIDRIIQKDNTTLIKRYTFSSIREFGIQNTITSIEEDQQGQLWVATTDAGLWLFNKKTESLTPIQNLKTKSLNKIKRDTKNNFWIGTNAGLYFTSNEGQQFAHFKENVDAQGISRNVIYDIIEDHAGTIWISGNGLDLFDPGQNKFQSYSSDPSDKSRLSHNVIWSFCEDDEGEIWIGTETGPINVFDPKTKSFKQKTILGANGQLPQNINSIDFGNNTFWIASSTEGLVRYDKKTNSSQFFHQNHNSILGNTSNITEVFLDRDETVWVGSDKNGLVNYNPKTDELIHFKKNPDDPSSLGSNWVNTIYQDESGNIWIGFWGGGLSKFDKVKKKFTNYGYDRKNQKGISGDVVNCILQDSDTTFWISTHSGLNKLNIKTGEFRHFFEKDGLANNVAYEILKDSLNNLWISTNGGLSRFNSSNNTFKTFTIEDGLQNNEFNARASLVSSTGEFYFGGINGFSVFRPEQLGGDSLSPSLVINSLKVFDQELPVSGKQIKLKHNQNYLTFQFAALEFISPEKIRYAFMLEGLEDSWVDAGKRRYVSYTNLNPGTYTFHLKAANSDGYWNEPSALVKFVISPPYWKTWWFLSLSFMAVVSFAYTFHRYRLTQSLKVERLRNQIASDLHDEVGSSLTKISIYSDLLQSGSEENQKKNYLSAISDLSREIIGTMSDIVWSIDNRNDSLGALIIRMKDFTGEMLQTKNIEFDFVLEHLDENQKLDQAIKQNIYLIFKETINNIVKHAAASYVRISIANQNAKFTMSIQDNGVGFFPEIITKGNGLINVKRRIKEIGGELEIINNKGTIIKIILKEL